MVFLYCEERSLEVIAHSNDLEIFISSLSEPRGPAIEIPIGRPCGSSPMGIVTQGNPAKLTGTIISIQRWYVSMAVPLIFVGNVHSTENGYD